MDFEQKIANILPDDNLKIIAHNERSEFLVDFKAKRENWWLKFTEHDALNGFQDKQDADKLLEYRATGYQLLSDLEDIIKNLEDLIAKNMKMEM